MRKTLSLVTGLALVAGLITGPAEARLRLKKVKGSVVRVEQQVRSENAGSFDRLTIRTRQGDEMHLRLGGVGECSGCYQIGDEIRARVRLEDGRGNECMVHRMLLRRDGRIYDFAFEGDRMVHHQERGHHGSRRGRGARSGRGDRGGTGG